MPVMLRVLKVSTGRAMPALLRRGAGGLPGRESPATPATRVAAMGSSDQDLAGLLRQAGVTRGDLVGLVATAGGTADETVAVALGAHGRRDTSRPEAAQAWVASPAGVARADEQLRPRWVTWSGETAARLAGNGVRLATCWDVTAVHRLLFGGWRADPGWAWAHLHGLSLDAVPAIKTVPAV